MTATELAQSLAALEKDFRDIPDLEKDFLALQKRLEVILEQAATLPDSERKSLLPQLKQFQTYLSTHMEEVQTQVQSLQMTLHDHTTHRHATQAYGKVQKS